MGMIKAGVEHRIRERMKLEWLRKYYPELPDIYNTPGFEPNGCGPDLGPWLRRWLPAWLAAWMAWFVAWVVPDRLLGLPEWTAAGDKHDWDYHVGGDMFDREVADAGLRDNMRRMVPIRGNWRAVARWARMRAISWIYYRAVRWGGRRHFNYW